MPNKQVVQRATDIASTSLYRFKVGAALYKGSSVINVACNTSQYIGYRKFMFARDCDPTRHAEMRAIHNINREVVTGSDILVVRLGRTGLTNSKPCIACMRVLKLCQIRRCWYSDYNGQILMINVVDIDLNNYHRDRKVIV